VRIQFWGTRGSIAKPGPATARYGGNTSCVEVRADSGTLLVVDCGTGAHDLGRQLVAQAGGAVDGHILISHTHWDHIQGIPFFEPLFTAGSAWDIYGPKGLSQSLRTTLAGQMEHTYFPITLDQFAATIRYHDLVEGAFTIGDVQVITRYLNHPALTLGYRFEADGASLAYCCDHEPHSAALASGDAAITGMDERYADFVAGADLVIHDAQYTAREYPSKVGWGHSPAEYAVRVCRDAGVKRLVLTHHDPLRDDDAVDRIIEAIRLRLRSDGASLEVLAAAEGLAIQLRDPGGSPARARDHFLAKAAIDLSSATRPVLLCLADDGLTAVLSEAVASEGLPLRVLADRETLLRAVAEERPSLVMVEHDPPRIDAHEVAHAIRRGETAGDVQVPVVIVTAGNRLAEPGNGIATDWLAAPFSLSYARTKIRAWALRTACRWMRAQMPADEDRRMKALRELAILDTAPEERIDRLTRIAATALDVPIALVSLVDRDRQWFKSCFGLSASETSRDAAFCAHAVMQRDEVVVPDALLDERFADNPLVVGEPRVRFYAGAPLILDDGSCIGTFCVIDTRPRELSEADMATLRDLRDLALEEIKRRRP
jgi:phosphoribosyl 1,2-cyclic phosphodiesterase/DNA-binding response OmpR family regulator